MINELFYIRNKNKTWTVVDRVGNSATGLTKQIAKNLYEAKYGIDNNPKGFGYDIQSNIINQQSNPFL